MKLIGIDYGQVRTGLAATDPENILAYPLVTLDFSRFPNRKAFLTALAERIAEENPDRVIIGLPLLPDGTESLTTRQVRNFAQRLQRRISAPCLFMNELLSSEEALSDLKVAQVRSSRIKSVLDQQAAVRILESYLHAPDKALPLDGTL